MGAYAQSRWLSERPALESDGNQSPSVRLRSACSCSRACGAAMQVNAQAAHSSRRMGWLSKATTRSTRLQPMQTL